MEHDLLGEEVGEQLQAEGTAVDVVAEEEKRAGSEVDAEGPQCASEKSVCLPLPLICSAVCVLSLLWKTTPFALRSSHHTKNTGNPQ